MSANMGWGMRRIIGVPGVAIGLGGSALAADLPPSPPPRARRLRTFPRCYRSTIGPTGAGVGVMSNAVGDFPGTTGSRSDNGGVVGGTLGANFQASAFVFGVEGDWDWSAINTGTTASICTFSGQCQTGNNWLATARGRAGYAADRALWYLTAGGAFANVQTNFNGTTTSHTQSGWTAGGGIEWAFADNWTAGNTSVNCVNAVCTAASSLSVTGVSPGPAIPVSIGLTEN